jgi:hypothetical protein
MKLVRKLRHGFGWEFGLFFGKFGIVKIMLFLIELVIIFAGYPQGYILNLHVVLSST